ncbi:hypothetical protein V9K67_13410 [Paraflavisolibacter sp. H34]|uniref:hypothetical protein n=1 Tax=Huijunlia imazamoxiresistens TaxID=3127457 RepID=UPI003016C0D5
MAITKFWSEQFASGKELNFLQKGGGGNAGTDGNADRRILMGTRDNATAYAGAEISVSDPALLPYVKVRFASAESGHQEVYGEGSLSGTTASVQMTLETGGSLPLKEYMLLAWVDANKNNLVDSGESSSLSDGTFAIVNQKAYTSAMGVLQLALALSGLQRAGAFLRSFLQHQPINYGGSYNWSDLPLADLEPKLRSSLSYQVGFDYDASGRALVRNFVFPKGSVLGADIRASQAFREVIGTLLHNNLQRIKSGNCQTGRLVLELPSLIRYVSSAPALDKDLYNAFGTATLTGRISIAAGCRTDGKAILDTLEVQATLTDLYDFNYQPTSGNIGPADYSAVVQAGYGTLGAGGHIFRTAVVLDTVFTQYAY